MNPLRTWRHWRQRRRFESDLDAELRFHLESRADDLQAAGLDCAEALRRARLELGAVELHKDDVRAAHGLAALDAVLGELRRALATLRRAPMFLAGSVTVLGLAVALNLVLFVVHQTYLGTPPETARPGALVDLGLQTAQARGAPWLTRDEVAVLRDALGPSALHVAAADQRALGHAGDPPRTLFGMAVDADYFRMLASRPLLGRALAAADDGDPQPRIVLGEQAWRSLTGSDPSIVGRSLALAGRSFTVVGVMPAGFAGLEPFRPQFWIATGVHEDLQRGHGRAADAPRYAVTIQLAPGASIAAMEQRAQLVLAALPTRTSEDSRIARVRLAPRTSQLSADESEDAAIVLVPLYGLLLLVLLIACANLGNLMLARALARRRELAIRASIGASRLRLVGLLLLEAALLAAIGTAVGSLLALLAADALHAYAASAMAGIGMDALQLRFPLTLLPAALALAGIATLAVGLAPALAVTGGDLVQGTRADGALFAGRLPPARLRAVLMVAQVGASAVLLGVAALAVQLVHRTGTLEVGYPAASLVDLRHPAAPIRLVTALGRIPGVQDVAAIAPVPLYGHPWPLDAVVDGTTHRLSVHHADHRVADVFGLRLLAGRWFDEREARDAAPVAVIGAATAARLWPGESAIGRRIDPLEGDASDARPAVPHAVIGVVADVATGLLVSGTDRGAVWLPGHAESSRRRLDERVLRVDAGAGADLLATLARTCLHETPGEPCMPWRLSDVAAWQRLPLEIARGFAVGIGLVALLISAAGLWGGVSYTVAARTHEIGVRRALGARVRDVLRLVLGGTLRQFVLGLLLALPPCVAITMALAGLGAGGLPSAIALGGVLLLLLATALLATAVPARRATAIAPTEALREG
jgi:macrolide transport system ATP-binding/permease protein